MNRRMLSDAQWARICDLLPGKPTDKGGRAANNRLLIEAAIPRELAIPGAICPRNLATVNISQAFIPTTRSGTIRNPGLF